VIIAVGGIVVQAIVNGFGTAFIAGFTATNKLYGLLEIAAVSYGYAVTTYVGQNWGAGEWGRIRSGMRAAVLLSLGTSDAVSIPMLVFGRPITALFLQSESAELAAEAGDVAYRYLAMMALLLSVLYLLYVYRSALQGMGNTVIPMASGIVEFVMRVGAAAVIGFTGFEDGIFYTEPIAWFGATVLLAVSYYAAARRLGPSSPQGSQKET
jgi:Na+-driven multidrug efflux pump